MRISEIVTTPFGLTPLKVPTIGGKILDIVFTKSAVLLNDNELLFNTTKLSGLPIPLLGFNYKIPDRLPLLKFKYSEYPFLTKNIISNCYMQEQTKFSIQAYNFLTTGIGVFTNIGFNMLLRSMLEKYILQGGTFMVIKSDILLKGAVWTETIEALKHIFTKTTNYSVFMLALSIGIMYDERLTFEKEDDGETH